MKWNGLEWWGGGLGLKLCDMYSEKSAVFSVQCSACVTGVDLVFVQTALTLAGNAVYSLHKTSTRQVSLLPSALLAALFISNKSGSSLFYCYIQNIV